MSSETSFKIPLIINRKGNYDIIPIFNSSAQQHETKALDTNNTNKNSNIDSTSIHPTKSNDDNIELSEPSIQQNCTIQNDTKSQHIEQERDNKDKVNHNDNIQIITELEIEQSDAVKSDDTECLNEDTENMISSMTNSELNVMKIILTEDGNEQEMPAEADNDDDDDDDSKQNTVIIRQLSTATSPRDGVPRLHRTNTILMDIPEELDLTYIDEKEEIFEYGFGTPFSYWESYTYYPYVAAKYNTLKEELLNNEIQIITINEWQEINVKAEQKHQIIQNILGQGADRNTPFARYNEQLNEIFDIKAQQKISVQHILSILFYTDLTNLPREMKKVCRKLKPEETKDDVKKRHSELVNWLKLLFEAIILYGNTYGTINHIPVYHGLNRKFYFREFKAKFYIPTSATTEIAIAQNFAEGKGIILEFGGLESIGDPYFDTSSLSAYPEEKEYLFFFAELPIKSLLIGNKKFDMSPLSLYQSIVSGNIMIDKVQSDKKRYQKTQKKLNTFLELINEENKKIKLDNNDDNDIDDKKIDEVTIYGKDLLKRFIKHNKTIWINKQEIMNKVTFGKLREKFIEQNADKSFKQYSTNLLNLQDADDLQIKNSDYFTWNNTQVDIETFLDHDGYLCSKVFKCADKAKFYCQMNVMDEEHGRISLILYKLPGGKKQKTVSFDLYCKALNKFYIRFHDITFKLDEEEDDSRQGADFKLAWIKKAQQKGKDLEWKITIGE